MSYIYLCIYRSWSILHSKALTEKDETQKAAKRDCPENDKTKVLGRIICPKISPQVFFFLFWSSCRVLHISQEIVEIESDLCVCVCQNLHFATTSMVFSWFFHILSQVITGHPFLQKCQQRSFLRLEKQQKKRPLQSTNGHPDTQLDDLKHQDSNSVNMGE